MKGLMYSLDEKMPRWTLSESRIGDNPGLGFRPMPKNISQGSLIWLDNKNASIFKSYVESIDDFLSRKLDNSNYCNLKILIISISIKYKILLFDSRISL